MYNYKPNDIIKLRDGNICKIIKIAAINEFGCDFHYSEKNYVVEFIEINKNPWASYQIYRNGKYHYVMTEKEF